MPTFSEIEKVGRTGDYSFDSGTEAYGQDARYEIGWFIQLKQDTNWDSLEPRRLLLDDRLPQYLAPYVNGDFTDPYSLLRSGRINRISANRLRIDVSYVYSKIPLGQPAFHEVFPADLFPGFSPPTTGPSGGTGDPSGDLTQLAPRWNYGYEVIDDIMFYDLNGTKVVNTAGDLFDPMPTKPTVIRTITTTRFETRWDEINWDDFCFVTNSEEWRGIPAGRCLMFPPTAGDYVHLGGVLFYPVTYTIKIKIKAPLDWTLRLDSYGFRELKDGKLVDIVLPTGKISKPWPLRGNGLAVPNPNTENPAQSQFFRYDEADFNDLDLILPPIWTPP